MTFIMILSMLGGAGAAERGAVAAEHTRLTEEMRSKATVSRWDAVDDHYRELRALRGAKLRYEDHWMGAQAASALGDIQSTWRRLRRALDVEFTDEALGWWVTLTAQYGEVHLVAKPSVAQPITLTISDPPLEPEKRATIASAQAALQADGAFHGLLPLGQYQLGEMQFEIIGGPAVREVIR
jgi:hypothetical protein